MPVLDEQKPFFHDDPRLLELAYQDLRSLARRHLDGERCGHTLQPTALVNEAYLRIARQNKSEWSNRLHFLAIASTQMRRILINHARVRRAEKRGGDRNRVTLSDPGCLVNSSAPIDALDLEAALEGLAKKDPRSVRIVEMNFYGGLSHEEIAEVLGVSERTVRRDWRIARAWLVKSLSGSSSEAAGR